MVVQTEGFKDHCMAEQITIFNSSIHPNSPSLLLLIDSPAITIFEATSSNCYLYTQEGTTKLMIGEGTHHMSVHR